MFRACSTRFSQLSLGGGGQHCLGSIGDQSESGEANPGSINEDEMGVGVCGERQRQRQCSSERVGLVRTASRAQLLPVKDQVWVWKIF